MNETESRSEIRQALSGQQLEDRSDTSVEVPAERSPKRSNDWRFFCVYGFAFGATGEYLKALLPMPIVFGTTVLLTQLIYLVFPAQRRRDFASLVHWARFTAFAAIGAAAGAAAFDFIYKRLS